VAPFCAVRRSPLTVMASDVSIEASLARFSLALLLDSILNPHFLILSLSDGYALLGAELEAQMAFGGGVGGFDDDGGVGIVEALGAEVQGFSAGDRVCVMPNYRLGEYGLYGDHAIVPVRSLIAPPPGLTVVEAASIWNKPERFARNRDLILYGLAEGRLKPIIAKTFPLGDIVEAHRYLESNQQVGKIVVTV